MSFVNWSLVWDYLCDFWFLWIMHLFFFPAVQAASVLEPTETSGCCQDSCGLCFHGEWRHEGRLIRKDKRRTGSILDTERWWKTLHVDGKSTHVLKHFWIIFRSRKVSLKLLQWHLNILESIYHLFGEDTNNLIASSFWQLRIHEESLHCMSVSWTVALSQCCQPPKRMWCAWWCR